MSKKIQIVLIGGQSNAVGCTNKDTLDEKDRDYHLENVYLYQEGNFHSDYTKRVMKGIYWGLGHDPAQMGIEYGMAYMLNHEQPEVGFIRLAWGGTNVGFHWQTTFDKIPQSTEDKGYCYYEFVNTVRRGLEAYKQAGFEPEIKGMVWMQGESDADKTEEWARAYKKNLDALTACIRKELALPDLKIIVGGISTQTFMAAYADIVREEQQAFCKDDKNAIYFDNMDVELSPDNLHYSANGSFVLGKRFGEKVKEFLL